MPLFKKKNEPQIPPVSAPAPAPTNSYSSGSSSTRPQYTYVASRDGDLYGTGTGNTGYGNNAAQIDRYSRNRPTDNYSRDDGQSDQNRNELFSGYNPSNKTGSGRFFDGPGTGRPAPNDGEENDEDVEGIKQQTRFVKQESVQSTRNALRLAREAEETARNTLGRLGDQSEKLANTERSLDVAKGYSQRASDKTDELKQLNRSIFRPVITFNKDAKRAAQEAKVQARYEEEREERERAMMDVRQTQQRIGQASTYGRGQSDEGLPGGSGRFRTAEQLNARKEQRKRYQFEATASDDEMENELDDNLDEIGEAAARLKAIGLTMGQELDNQINRIHRIDDKATSLDNKIFNNTERLKRIR